MKITKKLFSLLLVAMLVFTMVIPVFADDEPSGKITVANAEGGKTYIAYKVFDAEYSGTGTDKTVSYSTNNSNLIKFNRKIRRRRV